jgi:hypothetical protein
LRITTAHPNHSALGHREFSSGPNAPSSVVVKLSRTDLKGRVMGLAVELNREAFYYDKIAPLNPLKMPKCYYSFGNHFTGVFGWVGE